MHATTNNEIFVAAELEAPTAPAGNPFEGLVRPAQQQAANDGEPGRAPAPPSALTPSGGRANDAPAEPETPARAVSRDRQLMASAVGPRLQTARELAGLNQMELARSLDYENSTQIHLWERGARTIPLHMLVRAATVLGVPTDFLCGLAHEPERDPSAARRRAYLDGVRTAVNRLAEELVGHFEISDRLTGPDASHFRDVVRAADALVEAVQTLQRLSPVQFENMRGGAPVVRAVAGAQQAVLTGRAALRVHDDAHLALMRRLAVIGREDEVDAAA